MDRPKGSNTDEWLLYLSEQQPTKEYLAVQISEAIEAGIARVKRELYALCEDTEEKYHAMAQRDHETKQGGYARGRCVEAKSIARAMGEIFHELERQ